MADPIAPARGEKRRQWAIASLLLITPAAAVGGGLAIAPLAGLAGAVAASWPRGRHALALTGAVFALAAWAALSLFWTPVPRPELALKILIITATGVSLTAAAAMLRLEARRLPKQALVAAALLLALLLGVEAAFNMPLNHWAQPDARTELLLRNPGRGALVLLLLGFGALAALQSYGQRARIGLSAALLLALGALSLQFGMDANAAAFVLGAIGFGVGYAWPGLAPMVMGAALAAWQMLAPCLFLALSATLAPLQQTAPASWGMRLQVWDYAAHKIAERPLIGWGLDASRHFDEERNLNGFIYEAIPLHPHDVSLQIWLECGVIGAALFALVMAGAGWMGARICKDQRAAGAAACAAFAVLGLNWNISYGAWQEWFLYLPFIAAAQMLLVRRAA